MFPLPLNYTFNSFLIYLLDGVVIICTVKGVQNDPITNK